MSLFLFLHVKSFLNKKYPHCWNIPKNWIGLLVVVTVMIQLKENNKTTQPEISGVGTENVFLITCRVSRRLSLMSFAIHFYSFNRFYGTTCRTSDLQWTSHYIDRAWFTGKAMNSDPAEHNTLKNCFRRNTTVNIDRDHHLSVYKYFVKRWHSCLCQNWCYLSSSWRENYLLYYGKV